MTIFAVGEASTLKTSELIAGAFLVAITFSSTGRTVVTRFAALAARICGITSWVADTSTSDVVADSEFVDLLAFTVRAAAGRTEVSRLADAFCSDSVALATDRTTRPPSSFSVPLCQSVLAPDS